MIWFTSDTHFGHKRISDLSGRGFASIDEMDLALIANWNATVKPGEQVYHLGDFSFRGQGETRDIIARLNGRITLVKGNHDKGMSASTLGLFERVADMLEIRLPGERPAVLFHYPIESWNGKHRGSLHFHGHSHGSLRRVLKGRVDVGVDCHGLRPIHHSDAMAHTYAGDDTPTDHHTRDA